MNRISSSFFLSLLTTAVCMLAGRPHSALAQDSADGTVDLLTTPPELTATVDPNIVVSFDDSGSMARNHMGDNRPFDAGKWDGPWRCAGVIDPRATTGIGTRAMNGVYYNPNILYRPPMRADGTAFPNADASLTAVWLDGIYVNRPTNPGTSTGTIGYNNNKDSAAGSNDTGRTDLTGKKSGSTDRRWNCGWGSYPTAFAGGVNVSSGPYYYRLKDNVSISLNDFGDPTSTGLGVLYSANNWEAVAVTNTEVVIEDVPVNQWQNFANWYAYYRTRSLMTRTAMSRAFSQFGGNIRVAWQTIGCPKGATEFGCSGFIDEAGVGGTVLNNGTIITNLVNSNPAAPNYRDRFFDFLFSVPASINTPNRRATIRAGNFFSRPYSADLKNPYWQPGDAAAGVQGRELSCRKNFHMLVTDGYWNETDPSPLPTSFRDSQSGVTLPTSALPMTDGNARPPMDYDPGAPESLVFGDVVDPKYPSSLANIAFHYWATDLRPDLKNNVKPFVPDKTTGVTGTVNFDPAAAPPGNDPLNNKEIYFNPLNDPASWQHVVQFMITLGVAGNLNYSDASDCSVSKSDICQLRKGEQNSTGVKGWPTPVNNAAPAIDDTWHAAINSRGSYFSAKNPGELVKHLEAVINSLLAQSSASTPSTVSLPILTGGNNGYQGGYDSSDWSGSFRRSELDENGKVVRLSWDAGCLLTGGNCKEPAGTSTARDPDSRIIFTSDGAGDGKRFLWTSLGDEQKAGLSRAGADICATVGAVGCDAFGPQRVDYLRGKRDAEAAGNTPSFRVRSSLLGAVVNSEPIYVSSPRSGYHDMFPPGSPEAQAAAADREDSYAGYQNQQRARRAMVYVGANDGMLHAFDAESGKEEWAYVPDLLIRNGRLAQLTRRDAGLVPGVDSRPRETDVFVNGKWRTILLGSLRLGGRGIYALDVTSPTLSNEAAAVGSGRKAMWEFTSGSVASTNADGECRAGARSCASLGYTYDSVNAARLRYGDKWAAIVSSGYFPSNADVAAAPGDRLEAAAKRTSLLVIDIETGQLIREIKTTSARQDVVRQAGFKTFGLSTPMVYDEGSDEVDDIVYAGDLAGNLWRFDLSDKDDPRNWSVDLIFTTYGADGIKVGDQPIAFNPTALRDPVTRRPILVFGTGKYLGKDDRTSNIPEQAFYGIRDYGPDASSYPIRVDQLVTQTMKQATDDTRSIDGFEDRADVPDAPPMYLKTTDASGEVATEMIRAHGWRIRLNIDSEPGERAQRRAIPLPTANVALLYGLIPKSDDPCDPGARYSLMAIDAATGSPIASSEGGGSLVGAVVKAPAPLGDPVEKRGGDGGIVTGLPDEIGAAVQKALDEVLKAAMPPWHRGAWRELLGW